MSIYDKQKYHKLFLVRLMWCGTVMWSDCEKIKYQVQKQNTSAMYALRTIIITSVNKYCVLSIKYETE